MKFEVKNRWTGDVQFTADIECAEDAPYRLKLGLAVKWAIKSGANLSDANLSGANLSDADLSDAYLSDADLSDADLSGANLSDANLSDANLSDAYLSDADLSDADLSDANLSGANLSDANLSDAYLSGANLSGANLSGANLSGADLRAIKHDIWGILLKNSAEVDGLLHYIREGKINGNVYKGGCACLMGTIANVRNCDVYDMSDRNPYSPAERWFLGIREGDKPETSPIAKITEQWIVEFQQFFKGAA